MVDFNNSEVVRHILQTLINLSGRKTTKKQAISTMYELIKNLEDKYDFLKHIEIKDTRFLETEEPVSVMSDINSVKLNDVGKALYDIIKKMNSNLGRQAGYFFIKELKNNIGENYFSVMEEMGLNFGLMQLEFEVNVMSKKL
ncbi:MAG: hypothetical protein AYK22_02990 [Thermoplasmatales archaeon SG8-52-3]|nr:MAG: hypothetical protein AYK22_02990 [Thermoplasmatales archaeon SG8-52-3]